MITKKYLFALSAAFLAGSIVFYFLFSREEQCPGANRMIIEFTETAPEISAIDSKLNSLNMGKAYISSLSENRFEITLQISSEDDHQKIIGAISELGKMQELKFDSMQEPSKKGLLGKKCSF